MKRIVLVLALVSILVVGVFAQDLQGIGRDFEVIIESLGEALLPGLQQSAIWGQYPGLASYSDTTNFFIAGTAGAVFTGGILGFVDDPDAFEVLNVPDLFDGLLDATGNDTISGLTDGLKTFFPIPILRTNFGFTIADEYEAMFSVGGFPAFVTRFATGLADLEGIELGMGHFGGKVRRGILQDSGPFPAISVGGGYTFQAINIGYDFSGATGGYTQQRIEGLGVLNFKGDLDVDSRVHTFGLDLQASKQFGFFVPYLGLSPYYHISSFAGTVGADPSNEFDAFIDYEDGDPVEDVVYNGDAPDTAFVNNDLSLVLFGGFDLLLGGFVVQIGGSWSVPSGAPAASLTLRLQ